MRDVAPCEIEPKVRRVVRGDRVWGDRPGARVASIVIFVGWLGLLAYVWLWSRPRWGVGWALVGTFNLTVAALVAWVLVRVSGRLVRRVMKRR